MWKEICTQIIIGKTGHEPNWAGKKVEQVLHTRADSLLDHWQLRESKVREPELEENISRGLS